MIWTDSVQLGCSPRAIASNRSRRWKSASAAGHGRRLGIAEERHALVGVEVVLDPELLALGVDPHIGVRAIAVHVPPGARQAALAHQIGDLMRALRIVGPEVPLHVIVAQAGIGKPLLAADEVRELHRIAHEEHRRIVADEIVIALAGIEFQREAAHVAPGVGAAHLAGDGREARQHLGRRALLEQRRPGVGRDVLGGLEHAERAGALGVRLALRHLLAVEMRHLLEEMHVMQQDRAVGTDASANCGRSRPARPCSSSRCKASKLLRLP